MLSTSSLETAEEYLKPLKLDDLTAAGDDEAVSYWEALHPFTCDKTPSEYLLYTGKAPEFFVECMKQEGVPCKDTFGFVDYDSDDTYLAVRRLYWRFAKFFDHPKDLHRRAFAASLRLYALLPKCDVDQRDDSRFFPAALLPAKGWLDLLEAEIVTKTNPFLRPGDEGLFMVSDRTTCWVGVELTCVMNDTLNSWMPSSTLPN